MTNSCIFFSLLLSLILFSSGETDPGDFAVLEEFRRGLENPELLEWPAGDEDPCGSKWAHIFCSGNRVTQIQVAKLGLKGSLPQNFNKLSMLYNVGLQVNNFSGSLPSFSGLSQLQFAYLGSNQFNEIPSDFFLGLDNLRVLSLDYNPLNKSKGWILPRELSRSTQLFNLSLSGCNLEGEIPGFLGEITSLTNLKLSYNNLTGEVPRELSNLGLQTLWLNNQRGEKLTGSLDFLSSIDSLTDVWLHGNKFTGVIPQSITSPSLKRLWVDDNLLVGPLPGIFASMGQLQSLRVSNNRLVGPIPKLSIEEYSFSGNSFCQEVPGLPCSLQVNLLGEFLAGVNYPLDLSASWRGNDPCLNSWMGISCMEKNISVINLQNHKLNGYISPSMGELFSLVDIRLGGNNLSGNIPSNLTRLTSLRFLNLSSNNFSPPVPKFSTSVKVFLDGNPLLNGSPSPLSNSDSHSSQNPENPTTLQHDEPRSSKNSSLSRNSKKILIFLPVLILIILVSLVAIIFLRRRQKEISEEGSRDVVEKGSPKHNQVIKLTKEHDEISKSKSSELKLSVQALRQVTGDFSPTNELGRGGFGVVYKGLFQDGSAIAVKRMESVIISSKAIDEFQSEISVLSKVRHRNLVSLLGYSIDGGERLLVYEYMPRGALSRHLFEWKELELEPLSWKRRLQVALDVARGMEYLHNLAHQSFIHRDLKSSNILLDQDYRAKVSDFGLVKLAPDGKNSVVTRLAGTFGYLAPEYAGKQSFGGFFYFMPMSLVLWQWREK